MSGVAASSEATRALGGYGPLDTCINTVEVFWATVGHAARLHDLLPHEIADVLRLTMRPGEPVRASDIYGAASRIAESWYAGGPPPVPARNRRRGPP